MADMAERHHTAKKALRRLEPLITKKLTEIRRYDEEADECVREADQQFHQLCENWRNLSASEQDKERKNIKQLYDRALAVSNKKVKLADEMYQTVDQVVVKLDIERDGLREALDKLIVERKQAIAAFEEGKEKRKRRTTQGNKGTDEEDEQSDRFEPFDTSKLVPDIPVDPNEPTYCHCKSVSYGKMVMCDNEKCPIEWFHFKCVGLSTPPKGTWYCSLCCEEGDNTRMKKMDGE